MQGIRDSFQDMMLMKWKAGCGWQFPKTGAVSWGDAYIRSIGAMHGRVLVDQLWETP